MTRTTLLLLLLCLPARAAELTPDLVGKIQHEQQEARQAVNKKYENKELTRAERNQQGLELSKAEQAVLKKHNVDAKSYERYQASLSRDDRAAMKATEEALKEKKAKEKKAGSTAPPKSAGEIPVQKGFDESNPVEMETR